MPENIKQVVYKPSRLEKVLLNFYKCVDYSELQTLIKKVLKTNELKNLCDFIDKNILEPLLNKKENNVKSKNSIKSDNNGKNS